MSVMAGRQSDQARDLRVFARRLRLGLLLLLLIMRRGFLTNLVSESGDFLNDHLLHPLCGFLGLEGKVECLIGNSS